MGTPLLTVLVATAEQEVFHGEAARVIAPSVDGELAILPGHTPLLAQLRPGILRIYCLGNEEEPYECTDVVIVGGYLEAQPDAVTILADAIERADEIDAALAAKAVEQAKQHISNSKGMNIDRAIMELELAIARLQVARKNQPHSLN
ncbi:MAG: ATP synthase F1 subunit epsilon [Mariprofundales bacterium]|nr:ATP synthase F1 subunit epsilon [Mariprofundales bacterium]